MIEIDRKLSRRRINRNIVECKGIHRNNTTPETGVLIETSWNVKTLKLPVFFLFPEY